jgi:phosphomannomutase
VSFVSDLVTGWRAAAAPLPQAEDEGLLSGAIRAYDIRGVAGRDVGLRGAYELGLSYATEAREAGLRRLAVGHDGRITSASLEQALVWGLSDGGMRVERIGLCPTPLLAFTVAEGGLDGAIMVTAAHGPAPQNGFKIEMAGERVVGERLRRLVGTPGRRAPGGYAIRTRVAARYASRLTAEAAGMRPLQVVWDCASGAAAPIVERIVCRLPGRHHVLNAAVDGRFPAHALDPTVEANLAQLSDAVVACGADFGIAFDGDGARLGVVDGHGRPVCNDHLLLLLAEDLLAERPGATVVGDVKCSQLLFDGVAQAGGKAVVAPSGYGQVRAAMQREGAALGGELNGHLFFDDAQGDDGPLAAVRVLRAVSRREGGMAQFRQSLPVTFATADLRIACPEARKAAVVGEVAARVSAGGGVCDDRLGVRVAAADGWWLIRASASEPNLTCRCEASDLVSLDRLKRELYAQLAASGVTAPACLA